MAVVVVVVVVVVVTVMFFICNPKIAADHPNRHYQGTHTESEGWMDESVLSVPDCQNHVHQQCVEEEHKNPLLVHGAHANYRPGALQCGAVPVRQ